MDLVSVIVPVYKVEAYLDKCVRSILSQTYREMEVILVDDGSPDGCGRMCDEYAQKDSRVRVIHKKNGGLSDARNAGVKEAVGKYLLFVDSDDWIREDLIEKTVETAEQHSADIVQFDYYCVENGREEVRTCSLPADRTLNLAEEKGLLLAPPASWTKLFNREFYMKTGCFFPEGLYFEDLGTTPLFFLAAERIVYLKEPLYYYLIRDNSIMTGKNYEKSCHDKIEIVNRILAYYKAKNAFDRFREELEYLVFLNAYFEPSKELALVKGDKKYLERYRSYTYGLFPDLMENKYVRQLGKKDSLHLQILNSRQYWMMRLLSKARQAADKLRGR